MAERNRIEARHEMDEYVLDESVSRRYREVAQERPPPSLDRRLREAARSAARRPGWHRPLAIAATLALSVALVLEIAVPPADQGDATTREAPEPVAAPDTPSAAAEALPFFASPPSREAEAGAVEKLTRDGNRAARALADSAAAQEAAGRCAEHQEEPAEWLRCIEALEAAGESRAAAAERRALAERYPGAVAPPD